MNWKLSEIELFLTDEIEQKTYNGPKKESFYSLKIIL